MPNGFPEGLILRACGTPLGEPDGGIADLSRFVPQGFGAVPAVITPYSGAAPPSAYGFQPARGHPYHDAPLSEPAGGTLYFDERTSPESLDQAIGIMGVYITKDYLALTASSTNPPEERYLSQMRFVTHYAAGALFRSKERDPAQPLTIIEAVLAFVAAQKAYWDGPRTSIRGTAGGDGDWAKERLAFGFHVENSYWGVYRVWSRPWLITK